MKFELTYGTDKVSLTVPADSLAKDLPFIEPRKIDVTKEMCDVEGSIVRALQNPVDSPRLKDLVKAERIALTVSDEFRSGQQEMIIKCMLAEIALGKPKEVYVFCATGSHDPEIYAKGIGGWVKKYAEELGLEYKFFGHDCIRDKHIEIGKSADGNGISVMEALLTCCVRAYGHESKHHYMNGYSCIDKQLLPGLASKDTIEGNHKNALNDGKSFGGRNVWAADPERQDNPFSLGCHQARELSEKTCLDKTNQLVIRDIPTFGLDMISDAKHIYWIAAGNIARNSYEMTKQVDRLAAFNVEPVSYVVISPGGPPASQTIYSTQNCFDMALSGGIKDGGEALIVAPCNGRPDVPGDVRGLAPDEKSKNLFYDNLVKLHKKPLKESIKWIDENFELYLWKTDRVLKLMHRRKLKLYLHSTLPDEKVKAIGFIPVKNIQEWINERAKRNDSPIRIIDQGNRLLVLGQIPCKETLETPH